MLFCVFFIFVVDVVVSFCFDFTFFSQSPCMSNPCQHGPLFCRPIYSHHDYQCVCKSGFTGKYCGVGL